MDLSRVSVHTPNRNEGCSLVESRRRFAESVTTEFVLLLDSDQWLADSHAIEKCIETCEAGADAITFYEIPLAVNETFIGRVIDYDKRLFHDAEDDDPVYGTAIPRFFRASFFKRIDFSKLPPLTFEHTMIHKQIEDMGAKIVFRKDLIIYHMELQKRKQIFDKFFRYGYYWIDAYRINPKLVMEHSKPRRTYFTRKALRHPGLWLGLWYVYFIKATAATMGGIWRSIKFCSCTGGSA